MAAALLAAGEPPAPPPDAPPPDAELLLFLAEFGDAEGRFVDPTTIDDTPADARPAARATDDEDDDEDDLPPDPDR